MNISEKRDDFVIISVAITKDQYRYARSMADLNDFSVGEFLHSLLLNDMMSFDKAFKPSEEPTWCGATHDEWSDLYESASLIDD